MTALLLLAVALCPKDAPAFKTAGSMPARHFELSSDKTSKLTQNGKVLFTYSGKAEQALFAAEDRFLVLLEGDTVTLVTIEGMQSKQVKPLSLLTEEELRLVPSGECGRRWFDGWEETHYFLRLRVSQSALRGPTEAAPAPVELKLTWSGGELKRISPVPDLDPKSYAMQWSSSIEPSARVEVMERAARYAPGLAKAPHTADFVKLLSDVAARGDSTEAELRAVARCLGEVPVSDAMRLAGVLLARKGGADAEVLAALSKQATPESRALAAKVFHEKERSSRARAEAVRVATNGGAIANDALWLEAMVDAAPEVREAAAEGIAHHVPCTPKVFTALLRQQAKEEGPRASAMANAAMSCVWGDASPGTVTLLSVEEHRESRKLWASAYLELAFLANSQGDAAEARRLIDEGIAVKERSDTVNHARLLALRLAIAHSTQDSGLAAETLGDLRELKDREASVCVAEGEALKKFSSSAACEPTRPVQMLVVPKK